MRTKKTNLAKKLLIHPEEEIGIDIVCEWIDSLSKLWKRDLEYLDTWQIDDVMKNDLKKEKKRKSSKKVKLSVEDVKIDNPIAVLKFGITDPLKDKLQATTSEMVLGGDDLVGRLVLEIKLKRGAEIVVGTPGRIKDHTERHNIATRFLKQDK
ncbi:unnamed protein product [Brassica oleracea]